VERRCGSPRCRGLTLDLVNEDPGLVASTYSKKLAVGVSWATPLLLVLLFTLPWALRSEPARVRRLLLITAPALLIGVLPALFSLPAGEYLYGWLSALILVCLVTVPLAVAGGLRLRAEGKSLSSILLKAFPRHRLVGAATLMLLLAASLWGVSINSQANDWAAKNGGVLARPR
jgi:hypothetical protein